MDPLGRLLASNHRQTLEFFFVNLKDVSESTVDRLELLYNASVLAHYAQVPIDAESDVATPADLSAFFNHFVLDSTRLNDPLKLETAAGQCLLLSGFFQDQMRLRHNIHWYAELGASFFRRAAVSEPLPAKARLLTTLAEQFEPWRRRQVRLSRELRDSPYLIARPRPGNN